MRQPRPLKPRMKRAAQSTARRQKSISVSTVSVRISAQIAEELSCANRTVYPKHHAENAEPEERYAPARTIKYIVSRVEVQPCANITFKNGIVSYVTEMRCANIIADAHVVYHAEAQRCARTVSNVQDAARVTGSQFVLTITASLPASHVGAAKYARTAALVRAVVYATAARTASIRIAGLYANSATSHHT
jgi:hypothetical protein